jgi:hypothetical protein
MKTLFIDSVGLLLLGFVHLSASEARHPNRPFALQPQQAGEIWHPRATDAYREWLSVASSANGTKLVAAVSNGRLYTSGDSGLIWTPRESTRYWRYVASSADGAKLVAVVFGGRIYTSGNSGITWTAREMDRPWSCVASSADGTKLVASADFVGRIYTSVDSGIHWTPRASPRNWRAVASSADGAKLVAAEFFGKIYASTDSGLTWKVRTSDADRQWEAVASSADGMNLSAVEYLGNIYTSSDSGGTWITRATPPLKPWNSIACSADGTHLIASAIVVGGLFTSADSGATWIVRAESACPSVASSADGRKLIAVGDGKVFVSSFCGQGPLAPGATTLAASELGPQKATFNGAVDPKETPTTVWWEWGFTTASGNISESKDLDTITDPLRFNITTVEPSTEYHYRLIANNSFGTTIGDDIAFTTPPLVDRPTVHITLVANHVTVTWVGVGTLESARTAEGPYQSTGVSDGLFSTEPFDATMFYRVRH